MSDEASTSAIGSKPATLEEAQQMVQVMFTELQLGLQQLETLKQEVAVARAAAGQNTSGSALPSGCKASPPAHFTGKRDSEAIDSWLFSCLQYFHLTGLTDEARQIQFAGTLLRGPALVWFRTMVSSSELIQFINSWAKFSAELKLNFCPTNMPKLARDRLASLRQTTFAVRDYVRDFRTVCLDIPAMSEDEKLDRFVRGLKSSIRREVELRDPQGFDEAVKLAEKFDSTYRSASSSSPGPSGRFSRRYESDGPTPMELNAVPSQRQQHRGYQQGQRSGQHRSQSPGRSQFTRLTPELRSKLIAENKCLYCRESGHFVENCPKRPNQGNGRRPPTPGQKR